MTSPTHNFNTRLSALRTWLHAPPSPHAWDAVCAILDTWPNTDDDSHDFSTALDYATQALAMWPSSLRVAPRRWMLQLLQGNPPKGLQLAETALLSVEDLALTSTFALSNPAEITHRFEHETSLYHTLKRQFTPTQHSLARHLNISGAPGSPPPDTHTLRWACRLVRWGQKTTLRTGLACAFIALDAWSTPRYQTWSPVRWVMRSLPFFPPIENHRTHALRALEAAQDWLHTPTPARAQHALSCLHDAMRSHPRGATHNAFQIIIKSAALCIDPHDLTHAFEPFQPQWTCGKSNAAPEHGTPAAALWDVLQGTLHVREDTTHIIRRMLTLHLLDLPRFAPHLSVRLIPKDHPHLQRQERPMLGTGAPRGEHHHAAP